MNPQRILFVCLGNICRSPAAECTMRDLVRMGGLENLIECDSCGTAGYHTGSAPDARMIKAGKQRGLEIKGAARSFRYADFEEFDLIVTMDESNYQTILALDPQGIYHPKVRRMTEFCQKFSDREVPDPYYGGPEGFTYVLDLLQDSCTGLLKQLTSNK